MISTGEELHIDHANDIFYDSDKNILVVAHHKENLLSSLDTTMESESITNYDGNYYISFNSAGVKICELDFSILFE